MSRDVRFDDHSGTTQIPYRENRGNIEVENMGTPENEKIFSSDVASEISDDETTAP